MAAFARTELDLVGLARQDNQAAVQLFVIRDGKLIGRDVFLLEAAREAPDDEVVGSFLEQYYARAGSIPREVYVPTEIPGGRDLEAFLAGATRRAGPPPRPAARREARAPRARDAQRRRDAGARAGALAGRPGQDAPAPSRSWPRRSTCRRRRTASSATTSATSRAANRSAAWSSSRTASRAPASTGGSGSRPVTGPNDFASHQEVLRRRFRARPDGRRGRGGGAPLVDAGPRHRRRRARPGQRRQGGPRRARSARPAARRAGEGARGAVPAGPLRSDRPAGRRRRRSTSSSACATRRTGSRSRTTATCGRSGASARRSTTCRVSGRSAGASCSRSSAR